MFSHDCFGAARKEARRSNGGRRPVSYTEIVGLHTEIVGPVGPTQLLSRDANAGANACDTNLALVS